MSGAGCLLTVRQDAHARANASPTSHCAVFTHNSHMNRMPPGGPPPMMVHQDR
jgi:hypothetical protein